MRVRVHTAVTKAGILHSKYDNRGMISCKDSQQ